MGRMQRNKGANAEREVAKYLEAAGFMARRGQVFNGEPDIICPALPVHFEVKRHEELCIPEWFRQAAKDCGDLYPAVVYRQNYKPWMITMRVKDFLQLTTGCDVIEQNNMTRMLMNFDEFLAIMAELFK